MSKIRSAIPILLSLSVTLCVSCRDRGESSSPNQAQQYAAAPEITEDSGRHLSGEFTVLSVTDAYTAKDFAEQSGVVFKFTEDGTFRRERFAQGKLTSWDEGSYIIDKRANLALYVESAGGAPLASARLEVYALMEQSDAAIRLSRGAAMTFVLQKR